MKGNEFFVEIAKRPPLTKLHPGVASFFKDYLAHEKAIQFQGQYLVNTNFPPFPSPAFDNLTEQFSQIGKNETQKLYSVTVAVTNRCPFNCWHCYNAGRSQTDLPVSHFQHLARELNKSGAVIVTLTGGEPLLRDDLEEIVGFFDSTSSLILGTTGEGLTPERAKRLKKAGLFAVGISLDSDQPEAHDRMRGREGAFQTALQALQITREHGLFPYVVSVATREFLQRDRFFPFLKFAAAAGALEVHLLEPNASGKLAGNTDVLLTAAERRMIFDYQQEVAQDESLPILSSYAYLESPEAFGCGAGLTHLYIDGSGEVCPCNLVPLSFGNLQNESLADILIKLGKHFRRPRTGCVGKMLCSHWPANGGPISWEDSDIICEKHLPRQHSLPRFFHLRDTTMDEVGQTELQSAYNRIHSHYDDFWLSEASKPVDALLKALELSGKGNAFEAGCGTGYATAQLAPSCTRLTAADLSEGMLTQANARLRPLGYANTRFIHGDALAMLKESAPLDLVFSSWVLGYIPLKPFFEEAFAALNSGGRIAFVVHRENSPRVELEIFAKLVAEDPSVLQKRVAFDFPPDAPYTGALLKAAGFKIQLLQEGEITFRYPSADDVLQHLLKSGAGTAFYDAIMPERRADLTNRFLEELKHRHEGQPDFAVTHEYVSGIAQKS